MPIRSLLSMVAAAMVLVAVTGADAFAASESDWQECKAKDAEKSIAACTRILSRRGERPKDRAAALFNRGIAYADSNNDTRALEDYTESIRLDPGYARAYNSRGSVLVRKGEFERALKDFAKAIELDPKFANAYNNRGEAYEGTANLDAALESYQKALSLEPELARAYTNRGDIHLYRGDLERAVADYSKALRIRSREIGAYHHRAVAYLYLGESAKALSDITQASELDPKSARIALWLDIIGRRNQLSSRLSELVRQVDTTRWPSSLIRLFLNQTTLPAVVAATDNVEGSAKRGRLCDVSFFGGIFASHKRDKDEAIRLLGAAARQCPLNSIFRTAADAELKLLGAAL